jgi:oleate hydratase
MVMPAQPHFAGQPKDVEVFWGYALYVDKPGNFVNKPMEECSGREIFTEFLGHLHVPRAEQEKILEKSTTIPCMMPFITSQFLRRERGDRPDVLPKGWKNLAFTGQFCEQPDDVVFTIEYSVRSAANAVYGLLDIDRKPPAVYKGQYDPRVLYKALRGLHDIR